MAFGLAVAEEEDRRASRHSQGVSRCSQAVADEEQRRASRRSQAEEEHRRTSRRTQAVAATVQEPDEPEDPRPAARNCFSCAERCLQTIAAMDYMEASRVDQRLKYMTKRFAEHAPRWQYSIWLRNACLVLIIFVPRQFLNLSFDDLGNVSASTNTTGFTDNERQIGVAQTSTAIIVFAVFWMFQERVQPYPYRFQNRIEAALFFSDILIMTLGLVAASMGQENIPDWLEISMLLAVAGVLAAVVLYLFACLIIYCRSHRGKRDIAEVAEEGAKQLRMHGSVIGVGATAERLAKRMQRFSVQLHADAELQKAVEDLQPDRRSIFDESAEYRSKDRPALITTRTISRDNSPVTAHTISAARARRSAFEDDDLLGESPDYIRKDRPGLMTTRTISRDNSAKTMRRMQNAAAGGGPSGHGSRKQLVARDGGLTSRGDLTSRLRAKREAAGGLLAVQCAGSLAVQSAAERGQRLKQARDIPWSQISLEAELGDGGRGAVHSGTFRAKPVAVRQVSAARSAFALEALRSEVGALSQLRHPSLLRLIGVVSDNFGVRAPGIVMELGSSSLLDAVYSGRLVAGSWTAGLPRLLHEVAGALLFLHEKGAVHGRLHPSNIFLAGRLRVKLADFQGSGADAKPASFALRDEDSLSARWAYVAPEIAARILHGGAEAPAAAGPRAGRRRSSLGRLSAVLLRQPKQSPGPTPAAAADVWSFGCLVAFLGTGEPPYSEEVHVQVAAAQLAAEPVEGDDQEAAARAAREKVASAFGIVAAARESGEGPLVRLMRTSLTSTTCPEAERCVAAQMAEMAERCVTEAPAARPSAVDIFTEMRSGALNYATAARERASGALPQSQRKKAGEASPASREGPAPASPLLDTGAGVGFGAGTASTDVAARKTLARRTAVRESRQPRRNSAVTAVNAIACPQAHRLPAPSASAITAAAQRNAGRRQSAGGSLMEESSRRKREKSVNKIRI